MNKKHKQVIDEDIVSLPEKEEVYVAQEQPIQDNSNQEDVKANLEKQKQKLDEVEQAVSKQNSKKKKAWNWIFLVVNIVVVAGILVYQIMQDGVAPPDQLNIHGWPLLALIAVFLIEILSESFGVSYLIKRNVGKWHFGLAYKTNAIGRYYDNITPLAVGGQPFQIAYLKNHEVPLHSAMSIPLAKMVFHQICWNTISLVCLIVSFVDMKYNMLIYIAGIIGFVLGSALLFVIIFLSVSRNWGKKVIVGFLKLLQKVRILKNYEKQYEKIMKTIEDYQSVMRQYAKSPRDFIVILLTYFIKLFTQYSIPFFVFSLFSGFDWSQFFDFFIKSVFIDLAAGFIPLPGGTGMSELAFTLMLPDVGGTKFWALLIWRFLSLYFFLLQGVSMISYDMLYGNRKFKWNQRKDMLMQESAIFKQEQINRFRAERKRQRRSGNKRTTK